MKPVFLTIIMLILAFYPLSPAFAATSFNPNFLISDAEFTDYLSLDLDDIQRILNRGFLADYVTEDIDGRLRTATEIIWWTANTHMINPKVLLVMLQKEQSLIEDDDPNQSQLDWALGYGVCDNCTHDDPNIQRWRGFSKQLNSASLQMIEGYLEDIENDGVTVMGYGPGVTAEIDDTDVTFVNASTAALYTYTPHLHGNENFVKIWNQYFGLYYPSGTLLQDNTTGGVYLIQFGEKRPITSQTALLSRYNPNLIIPVDPSVLNAYPEGTPISFANYSLLQDEDGVIYLLVDDVLKPIASMDDFRAIGFVEDELIVVANDDLNGFTVGETVTAASDHPQGSLLQDTTTGGVYYVEDGIKQAVQSRDVLNNRFTSWSIVPTATETLEEYPTGEPVKFFDGTLIKATESPDVFVVSEGLRRPIPSEEVFLGLGYEWEDIVVTDERSVLNQPLGDFVYLIEQDDLTVATSP